MARNIALYPWFKFFQSLLFTQGIWFFNDHFRPAPYQPYQLAQIPYGNNNPFIIRHPLTRMCRTLNLYSNRCRPTIKVNYSNINSKQLNLWVLSHHRILHHFTCTACLWTLHYLENVAGEHGLIKR